ncbi:MAG TPA: hypothetical protein VGC65_00060 [Bacteroidia bacterium]|jgi:hypothetical protein
MNNKELLKIDYSPSFKGLLSFSGLFVFVFGGILLFGISEDIIFLFYGLTFLAIGLILFLAIKGVVINCKEKSIRTYREYILFKIGKWQSIKEYNQVKTFYEQEVMYGGKHRWNATKLSSYEVNLVNAKGEKYCLKEFANLKDARKLMKDVSEKLSVTYVEEIEHVQKLKKKTSKR